MFRLDAHRVAKVWFNRPREAVERLQAFYRAAAQGPLRVTQVQEIFYTGAQVVSVEHFVAGAPLGRTGGVRGRPTAATARLLGDALAGLADTPPHPALSSLPMLPDQAPAKSGASFNRVLADLVSARVPRVASALDEVLDGQLEAVTGHVLEDLDRLQIRRAGLVHGDLVPDNVLIVDDDRPGVIDFGFLTTYGDPDFDVAITPAIFDMYGPDALQVTDELTEALTGRFGTAESTIHTYRHAYALITAGAFGSGPEDGHFTWCANLLRRSSL